MASFLGFSFLEHIISYITANFPQMCLMLDQFLWGDSSRVCDISCLFQLKSPLNDNRQTTGSQKPGSIIVEMGGTILHGAF